MDVSDEEWEDWLKFLEEYNKKKEQKRNESLLYWVYRKLKGEDV